MSVTPFSKLIADRQDSAVALGPDGIISFSRFYKDIGHTILGLRRLECRRIALFCHDSYMFAVGFFAAIMAGIEIAIPPNGQPGTLARGQADWDQVVTDIPDLASAGPVLPFSGAASSELAQFDAHSSNIDFYTSGSVGAPKCIRRTLAQLETEVAMLDRIWGEIAKGPVQATVSHQHIYGLTFKVLWPMASRRPFSTVSHEVWEPLLADLTPGSIIVSSPAHLSRLGGLTPLDEHRLPTMIVSAGAPLPLTDAAEVERILGVLPTEIYGSTETGAIAARRQHGKGTPWTLLPGNRVRQAANGRFELESPWSGHEGFQALDDHIDLGDDGRFHLLGRADRVVKVEGKRIGLHEIEEALRMLPFVNDAAVVLTEDEKPTLAAVVSISATGRTELERLGAFRFGRLLRSRLSSRFEASVRPRCWRFVDEIPTGPLGKRSEVLLISLFRDKSYE